MSRNWNAFLDLEASATSDNDSEEESPLAIIDQEFLQEDHGYEFTDEAHPATLNHFQSSEYENEEDHHWRELIAHARERTITQCSEDNLAGEEYKLEENDMLWEIGCTVGSEEAVVFKILERALHPSITGDLAISVVATTTPGRIYAESHSVGQVRRLARSFAELDSRNISPVPRENFFKILNFTPSHMDWPWARVRGNRGKWRWYVGDTGLITKIEGLHKRYLALIPRIGDSDKAQKTSSRPPQALAVRRDLGLQDAVRAQSHGNFLCKGQMFSAEGLLLVDLDDIDILPLFEPFPSSTELACFRSTTLLSTVEAKKTSRQIAQMRMKIGDRVKVISGPYHSLIGDVKEVKENEVAVYLSSQGIVEDMPKDIVRAAFSVGDMVKVLDGQSNGLEGWVIGISEDTLRVLGTQDALHSPNDGDLTEVSVSKSDVEFHVPPQNIGLRPRDAYAKWGRLDGQNPNDVYNSMRVMVIGNHVLKGYKGVIKSTTLDGYAFLQLDSRLQQSNKVKLTDLACLTYQETYRSRLSLEPCSNVPLKAKAMPSTQVSSTIVDVVGSTPAWDPSDSSHMSSLSPAWDPTSRASPTIHTPARPMHWLNDTNLHHCRIKLKTDDPSVQSPYIEFLGIEMDLVKVRDKADVKFLPLDSVHPLIPTSKGDVVVAKGGEMQGILFHVIRIAGDFCVVRQPGSRLTRKSPDIEITISDLIQVYPPIRRR